MDIVNLDFSENLRNAGSFEETWKVLNEEISNQGFLNVCYGFTPFPDLDKFGDHGVLLGEYSNDEFQEVYIEQGLIAHDYTTEHCIVNVNPISWAEIDQKYYNDEFSGKRKFAIELAIDCNLKNGLTIPLRDSSALSRGGLTLQGDPYMSAKEFDAFLTESLPSIRLMAEIFHCNVNRSTLFKDNYNLSPREKECLLWIAYGLQVDQVAFRLGTHIKTVEKQLYSARKKLGARNTTQAVIKGLLLGQIEL